MSAKTNTGKIKGLDTGLRQANAARCTQVRRSSITGLAYLGSLKAMEDYETVMVEHYLPVDPSAIDSTISYLSRAKEIILTGRPFTAAEAHQWGMVNRVCAPGKVVDEALETGRRVADNAPISVRQTKHAIHYGMQMDLASGMMLEIEAYNRMVPTDDRREGVRAFNEKRKPRFTGR